MRSVLAALLLCFIGAIPANADPWCGNVRPECSYMLGATPGHETYKPVAFGSLADRARAYMGETARDLGLPSRLWCADFLNKITGGGTGSRQARSYIHYGSRASEGCIGCIAVLSRGRGGHVGIVTGWDGPNPIIISGNHGHRVGEGVYPRRRLVALRTPA